jgi:hypothetical protein
VNAKQFIGPIFYAETIDCGRYVTLTFTELIVQLTEQRGTTVCEVSATVHTADDTGVAL